MSELNELTAKVMALPTKDCAELAALLVQSLEGRMMRRSNQLGL
ncbi:hypothetical protein [Candidatus Methylomirabilis sp.]